MTLDEIRAEIDVIDNGMAVLLARRMALAAEVAATKRETGAPILHPERERAIIARLGKRMEPQYLPALETIYEAIFRASREYQETLM